jgi:hypothetical protein
MSRRKWVSILTVVAIVGTVAWVQLGTHNVPAGQPSLATLNGGSVEDLRAEFNRRSSEVRLVLLLSPT